MFLKLQTERMKQSKSISVLVSDNTVTQEFEILKLCQELITQSWLYYKEFIVHYIGTQITASYPLSQMIFHQKIVLQFTLQAKNMRQRHAILYKLSEYDLCKD